MITNTLTLSFKNNNLIINLAKNKEKVFGLNKKFYRKIDGKGMGLFMVKLCLKCLDEAQVSIA